MLQTSENFKLALQHDTMKITPRIRWWFSWNHLLEPEVSLALNTSIDSDLFPPESVLNSLHQTTSGSAYAITGASYTSTDPRYGYRTAPSDSEINPILQLSTRTAGSGGTTPTSRINVDYGQEVEANTIEIQLETLRTASTSGSFHAVNIEVFYKDTSDSWVSAYSGTIPASAEGRRLLYYNGSSWTTTKQDFSSRMKIKGVRLAIQDTTVAPWNPKIRYVGAHDVVDVTSDIIEFNVTKSESEQLTYMPFSEPVTNTADLSLDNTAQEYAYRALGEDQPYYDLNMRFDFELGIDRSYVGGTGIEYVSLGTFYLDGLSYSTDLDINMEMSDYSKFFQRKFIDDAFWQGKSIKFIIKDILARTGFNAGVANFNTGVDAITNEKQKLPFSWYKSDTLLWDALADIVKSELGTFFIQEDGSYLFTDRGFLNNKIEEGVQWTIDADIDLESANQEFTVDANEVEVGWVKMGKNIDERGLVYPEYIRAEDGSYAVDYTTSGPIEVSSPLWEPGGSLAVMAATLHASMNSTQTFVRLSRPLGDTFPEEGIINIEGEYMEYTGKEIENNYVELTGLTRGIRNTTPKAHQNGAAQVASTASQAFTFHTAAELPNLNIELDDGRFVVEQVCTTAVNNAGQAGNTYTCFRPFGTATNPSGKDYAYGCRFHFEDFVNENNEANMAGMFVHAKTSSWGSPANIFDTYWIEIVSVSELINSDYITGSLRVYRTSDKNTLDKRSGLPPTTENAIYGHDGILIGNDIPVNIDVYWDHDDELFSLYVNDVFMTSWKAEYVVPDGLEHPDAIASGHNNNYEDGNTTGYWGIYVRGNTKASFEYVYGGELQRQEDQFVANYIYGGFTSQQDLHRQKAEHFMEYGAIAHELRRFEVEHQVWPNRWVRIFHSNELEAQVINEKHTSFSSEFEVINTSRSPAILVGNDSSVFNHGLGANHQFFVYGATVIEIESGEQIARDKHAIRKRGISNVRVESPWIQSDRQAKRLANWVTNNWSEPVDFYEIEWFPMWALQPGDRIDINYPEKGF